MRLPADTRDERRLPLQLGGQRLDGAERRLTDVMFHALDIVVNDLVVDAEQFEKIGEQLMAPGDIFCERFTGGGEDEAAIFFVMEETFGIEALDHVGDAGLGNAEGLSDIDDPGISLGVDELEDAFEVIFDSTGEMPAWRPGRFGGHGVGGS
jgi:hypothetical protein